LVAGGVSIELISDARRIRANVEPQLPRADREIRITDDGWRRLQRHNKEDSLARRMFRPASKLTLLAPTLHGAGRLREGRDAPCKDEWVPEQFGGHFGQPFSRISSRNLMTGHRNRDTDTNQQKNQGEGYKASAQRFKEEEKTLVRSGKVKAAAKSAREALEGSEREAGGAQA
jgi:hypothetical protein